MSERDGAGRVSVQQHGVALDREVVTAGAAHHAVGHHPDRALGDLRFVMNHRAGLAPGYQGAVVRVRTVGDPHDGNLKAGRPRGRGQFPVLSQHDQRPVERHHGLDHRGRIVGPGGHQVAETAMRRDMPHPSAMRGSKGLQCADLVKHVGTNLVGRQVHRTPAEPGEVGKTRVGTHRDATLYARGNGRVHDARVARVETARDVRGGQDVQQRVVVAHPVGAEPLTEISDEIDPVRHFLPPECVGSHCLLPD